MSQGCRGAHAEWLQLGPCFASLVTAEDGVVERRGDLGRKKTDACPRFIRSVWCGQTLGMNHKTHTDAACTHTHRRSCCAIPSFSSMFVHTHTHTHTYIPVVLNHHGAVEYLPFSTCTHIDPTTSPPLSSCHLIHFIYCPTKATSFDRSLTTARKSASVKRRGEV